VYQASTYARFCNGVYPQTTTTGALLNIRNTLNKKPTRHSGPRYHYGGEIASRIGPVPGPFPPKYREFKINFAWTDFLYSVAYP
jgi:hypothetical protein